MLAGGAEVLSSLGSSAQRMAVCESSRERTSRTEAMHWSEAVGVTERGGVLSWSHPRAGSHVHNSYQESVL